MEPRLPRSVRRTLTMVQLMFRSAGFASMTFVPICTTYDGGVTWQSISAGLPDGSPVNTVREDPIRKGLLFAGTGNRGLDVAR